MQHFLIFLKVTTYIMRFLNLFYKPHCLLHVSTIIVHHQVSLKTLLCRVLCLRGLNTQHGRRRRAAPRKTRRYDGATHPTPDEKNARTSQHFLEPEGSLPCSQGPSTGPYPKPDESSAYHHNLSKIHFNIIHPPTSWSSYWSFSFWLFHQVKHKVSSFILEYDFT
jgi:hypothetical protein